MTESDFTPRQQQMLACLSRGLENKVIAREIGISVKTVEQHIRLVLRRGGWRRRYEAGLWMVRREHAKV